MRLALLALSLFTAACVSPASSQEAPPANSGAAVSTPEANFLPQARAILEAFVADDRFSGAVLAAKDGKAVLRAGYGLANREHAIALTPEAIFRLGSLTKQFTAAAILQLAEQDKLGIDDPVSKHYPAAPAA
jgi:CubicO group peptidase (beta-lactamase class C family)